jgi:signal peptidase II
MFLPFLLTALILLADQGVKSFIVKNWPGEGVFIKDVFNNDVLWIIHVRNKAIAFSLGDSLPLSVRPVLFIVLPLLVLGFLLWYYFSSKELTYINRWAIGGIIGGGMGNLIDRIWRPDGVVDFISVKFYGIFGFERWPTFNIADASVVISVLLFLLTMRSGAKKTEGKEHE